MDIVADVSKVRPVDINTTVYCLSKYLIGNEELWKVLDERFHISEEFAHDLSQIHKKDFHVDRPGVDGDGVVSCYFSVIGRSSEPMESKFGFWRDKWVYYTTKVYLVPDEDVSGDFTLYITETDTITVYGKDGWEWTVKGKERPMSENPVLYTKHFSAGEVPNYYVRTEDVRIAFPFVDWKFHKLSLERISNYVHNSKSRKVVTCFRMKCCVRYYGDWCSDNFHALVGEWVIPNRKQWLGIRDSLGLLDAERELESKLFKLPPSPKELMFGGKKKSYL